MIVVDLHTVIDYKKESGGLLEGSVRTMGALTKLIISLPLCILALPCSDLSNAVKNFPIPECAILKVECLM